MFPIFGLEVLATSLVFVSSALAGATGIGGGILFVVFFVMFLGYNSSEVVALSQFTMIGSSFAPAAIKFFLRHPTKDKPLIDYDVIIIILSPLVIGVTIGVIINISLPYWVILLVLILLLVYLSSSVLKSSLNLYKKETAGFKEEVKPLILKENAVKILGLK